MKEIDYTKIDKLCVPLVKLFNSIGLNTKFCCEGHYDYDRFYIMFHESVKDEKIMSLIKKGSEINKGRFTRGSFKKWIRPGKEEGKLLSNWLYEYTTGLSSNISAKECWIDYDFALIQSYKEEVQNEN